MLETGEAVKAVETEFDTCLVRAAEHHVAGVGEDGEAVEARPTGMGEVVAQSQSLHRLVQHEAAALGLYMQRYEG